MTKPSPISWITIDEMCFLAGEPLSEESIGKNLVHLERSTIEQPAKQRHGYSCDCAACENCEPTGGPLSVPVIDAAHSTLYGSEKVAATPGDAEAFRHAAWCVVWAALAALVAIWCWR